MPGQAIVSINGNQWSVSIASTYDELTIGLRGVSALAAGTGMLFVLPGSQDVSVDTRELNFPIDIVFISQNAVIDVASDIQPGYLVTEQTPCDMFLEVNAGEATGVESGDTVSIATIQEAGLDLSQIMSFAVPLAALGFVCAMAGGMAKLAGGSSSSHSLGQRRLGKPKSTSERLEAHKRKYGTRELPTRGTGQRDLSKRPDVVPIEPRRRPRKEEELQYLADSPEFLTQTIEATGYRGKLDSAFQEAIKRAKGLK